MIFTIDDKRALINESMLLIPEFKRCYNKYKKDPVSFFTWLYYLVDYKAPGYSNLSEGDRIQLVDADFNVDNYSLEDPDVYAAYNKYLKLQDTPSMKLYKAAMTTVHRLADYFTTVTFDASVDAGKEATSAVNNLKNLGGVIESLKKLETVVKLEIEATRARGNVYVSSREKPKES